MTTYSESPNLGGSLLPAGTGRPDLTGRPGPKVDENPGIGVLRLITALRRMVGAISRWRRRRSAVRALQALSDRHLRDIGLDRSQIVSRVEASIEAGGRHDS